MVNNKKKQIIHRIRTLQEKILKIEINKEKKNKEIFQKIISTLENVVMYLKNK
ncbi:MAG: hypothetical protein VX976_02145 [Pseudomonadota bacterium]|nr:hypothetical protein [Pseudomonadota bacterium]